MKEFTHQGSKNNLLGSNPDPTLVEKMSGECSVPDDCPPAFIWHTADDTCVDVNNSLLLATALHAKKIPFEMHIFPDGNHGRGLAEDVAGTCEWSPLMIKWLKRLGF